MDILKSIDFNIYKIKVISVENNKPNGKMRYQKPISVLGCIFLVDGLNLLAYGVDRQIKVFNTSTGELVKRFFGHDNVVTSVSLYNRGNCMVSSSYDSRSSSTTMSDH